MASSLALRRATASTLLKTLASPLRPASSSVTRSFNTNAQMSNNRRADVKRRSDGSVSRRGGFAPGFFADVFPPFLPTRSLSQVLNLMDQLMENPFLSASHGRGGGLTRRGWDVKEDADGLYLRMDMPGVGKDQVKISVEQNTLVITGKGEKESEEEEEYGRRYSSRLDLPPKLYKIDGMKAEMKNGILKVAIPKVKEKERKDVFQVKVD